jgi:hypothetical protein
MYQTDVLEILWILADLGVRNERAAEALEEVARARGRDGRWTMRNSYKGIWNSGDMTEGMVTMNTIGSFDMAEPSAIAYFFYSRIDN